MKFDPFVVFISCFLILFFGAIILSGFVHSKNTEKFEIKCTERGGVMFVPKGVKGWPVPECRNPNSMIDMR